MKHFADLMNHCANPAIQRANRTLRTMIRAVEDLRLFRVTVGLDTVPFVFQLCVIISRFRSRGVRIPYLM
jgi:hypothetical protein